MLTNVAIYSGSFHINLMLSNVMALTKRSSQKLRRENANEFEIKGCISIISCLLVLAYSL